MNRLLFHMENPMIALLLALSTVGAAEGAAVWTYFPVPGGPPIPITVFTATSEFEEPVGTEIYLEVIPVSGGVAGETHTVFAGESPGGNALPYTAEGLVWGWADKLRCRWVGERPGGASWSTNYFDIVPHAE